MLLLACRLTHLSLLLLPLRAEASSLLALGSHLLPHLLALLALLVLLLLAWVCCRCCCWLP
jgi:hypothetical protein